MLELRIRLIPIGPESGAKTSHDGELNLAGNLRLGCTRGHPRLCGVPWDVQADVLHSLSPDWRLFLSVDKFFATFSAMYHRANLNLSNPKFQIPKV